MSSMPSNTDDADTMHVDVDTQNHENAAINYAKMSISEMKEELGTNPYQYDLYVRYLDALRTKGRLNDLKKARDAFASIYALTDGTFKS